MIVFPMAGLSSRFSKAGYMQPKYMLEAHGKTIFEWTVSSFSNYFKEQSFLFIARETGGVVDFISNKCKDLGIVSFQIVVLEEETRGQAETVYLGLEKAIFTISDFLLIFNIDTILHDYTIPSSFKDCIGYLDVFIGGGANWSYVKPFGNTNIVEETAEKNPISNLCSNGLYYFDTFSTYKKAYFHMVDSNMTSKGEYYIAPMYNFLTATRKVYYHITSTKEITFCGIPEEYEAFLSKKI